MKIILISTLITIVTFFIVYILFAFIAADINFKNWSMGFRLMLVIVFCFLEVLALVFLLFTYDKDKNNG